MLSDQETEKKKNPLSLKKKKSSKQASKRRVKTQRLEIVGEPKQSNKMRMAKENQSCNPNKLESLIPRKGFGVVHLMMVLLMGFVSKSQGRFIVTPEMQRGRDVPALYVLGDSSVDCGDNTLFYPLLHRNLSLYPCNGSDSTLLPHLLGIILSFLFSFFKVDGLYGILCFLLCFLGFFCFLYCVRFQCLMEGVNFVRYLMCELQNHCCYYVSPKYLHRDISEPRICIFI